ncbi:hypothetical protein [Chryseobacterium sp. HR92]|uniref:hypothetical protein n=1 Tax=Chryseobacterium sp. HR92 TaxID=3094839 RepID=UPI00388CEDBB|nr:hypothetical protein SFA27_16880 [Chryseobacterium sp. HR92]
MNIDDILNEYKSRYVFLHNLSGQEEAVIKCMLHEKNKLITDVIKELISELDPATLCGNYQEAIDKANLLLEQFTHCTQSKIGEEINLFNY